MMFLPLEVIPEGPYCYTYKDNERLSCPYWSIDNTKEDENNGYCLYLNRGDWQVKGLSLLWDQVKECGINDD